MKKHILVSAIIAMLSGCTSRTEFGECVGVFDEKKPDLEYKLSVWNTVMAVVFSETIVVPVVVVANETHCPVGKK